LSKHRPTEDGQVRLVETGWSEVLLICRKCSKKLKGGFGPEGRDTLRTALRGRLRESGRRGEVGLIEVKCFGVCPKGAVTVAMASEPGVLRIVPKGSKEAVLF